MGNQSTTFLNFLHLQEFQVCSVKVRIIVRKAHLFLGSFLQSLPGCFSPQLVLLHVCDAVGHGTTQCPDWLYRIQNRIMTARAGGLYAPWPRKGRQVLVDRGLLD